jgi:transposase
VLWRPVADRLAGYFELVLVNAQHMKRVPGRKTDVQDAEWLTDLLQHGLLTPSFVPGQPQQDLRDLTRLRVHLLQDRTQLVNRLHKVLQQAGIKLSGVLSNILGASGRAIVQALCTGESDPERLASLVHKSIAHKDEQLVEALTGDLREHHRFALRANCSPCSMHKSAQSSRWSWRSRPACVRSRRPSFVSKRLQV